MPLILLLPIGIAGVAVLLYLKEKSAATTAFGVPPIVGSAGVGTVAPTAGGSTAVGEEVSGATQTGLAVGTDIATGNVAGAAAAAVSGIITQLTQHTARLKDATNENQALDLLIPQYDIDFRTIVAAYNSGEISPAQAIAALQQLDSQVTTYLKKQVGKPGTAWTDAVGLAGKCNAQCTAGCCVYFGDLGPPLSLTQIAIGGAGGLWKNGDPRLQLTPTGGIITVPEVYPPTNKAYGNYQRAGYTVTITHPATTPTSLLATLF